MQIPEHIIDQVRQRSDIVEIIGESVAPKVRILPSDSARSTRPQAFDEREPDLQIFKCFSCGKGGNVFILHDRLPSAHFFIEAVKTLAAKAGIVLPDEDKPDDGSYNRRFCL